MPQRAQKRMLFFKRQEDFVDLLCDLLPPVIEGVLIHRQPKALAKEKYRSNFRQ